MVHGYLSPMATWMVVLLVGVITKQGCGWNLPNTYYQGAGNGYVGGRNAGTLSNQALAGASAGAWNAGGVGRAGDGFPFQGQLAGGVPGGVDRTGGFGANQWAGGDGSGGVVGGVSTASDSVGADGTGYHQGGGSSSRVPLATGSEAGVGYNNQGSLANTGGSNVGLGQFNPNHGNGPALDTSAFGSAFGASDAGFGAGGHFHGDHPDAATYGHPSINRAPSVQPWRYGAPASYGGYGGASSPWLGSGYVYRVPVAHINPDGSYSFSYYTPHSSREEIGHSNGNVQGTYGFQNDGAKHNFSFNAGPDVDLRSSIGNTRVGALNPEEYGPQSVHSRSRLPLAPATIRPAADEQTRTPLPNSWSGRSGVDGSDGPAAGGANANDQSTLSVVGLPKATTEATDISQPTAPNQIVRGSTEDPVGANDLDGRLAQPNDASLTGVQSVTQDGTATTVRPLDGTVEQVVTRPENEIPSYSNEISQHGGARDGGAVPVDRSYRFGYQTPDAARDEAADQAGNVRGSFSYNNEAGRNDLQYVAGAGMGFRPTGGSLSVPNGLAGVGSVPGGPVAGDGRYQFGYRTADSERDESADAAGNVRGSYAFTNGAGRNDLQYVAGAGTGFRATGGSLSVPNGQRVGANTGSGSVFGGSGSGFGNDGLGGSSGGSVAGLGGDGTQTGAEVAGSFGVSDAGLGSDGGASAFGNQGGQLGVGSGGSFRPAGFGADGRSLASGNQGTQLGTGVGRAFGASGNQGTQLDAGAGGVGGGFGTGFAGDGRSLASANQGTQLDAGAGGVGGGFDTGFAGDGRSLASGNRGTQFGVAAGRSGGSFGTGFGSDGRSLASGNQGTQFGAGAANGFGGSGGSFGTGFGGDGRSVASGYQGTQFGTGAANDFGRSGGSFGAGFGNQGAQYGAGARGTFGGSDGRSVGFGNQAGQGFSTLGRGTTAGFTGSQGTTHNPVTRSPPANAFDGFTGPVSTASEDGMEDNTTIHVDDFEQTTTFGGYGETNGNRRLVQ